MIVLYTLDLYSCSTIDQLQQVAGTLRPPHSTGLTSQGWVWGLPRMRKNASSVQTEARKSLPNLSM